MAATGPMVSLQSGLSSTVAIASVPVDDVGFASGLTVFEALRTFDRRPHAVALHHARLAASASWMGIECPDLAVFQAEVTAAAAAVPGEAAILVYLTGGRRRLIRASPLDLSRVGAPIRLASLVYEPPSALPGFVKHTNRAAWLLAARRANVDEVIFVGAEGAWSETNRSSVLVVRGSTVFTAPTDGRILDGVTRRRALDAADAAGILVQQERAKPGPVDELYVVSTFKSLAPVVALDGALLPGWGPVGEALRLQMDRLTAD